MNLSDLKAQLISPVVLNGNQTLTGVWDGDFLVRGDLTVTGSFIVKGTLIVTGNLTLSATTNFYVERDLVVAKYISGTFTGPVNVGGRFVNLAARYAQDLASTVTSATYNAFISVTTVGTPTFDSTNTIVTINTSVPAGLYAGARISPFTANVGPLVSATGTTVTITGDVTASVPNGTTLRLYIPNNSTLVIVGTGGANASSYLTPAGYNKGFLAARNATNTNYYTITGNVSALFTAGAAVSIASESGSPDNPDLGVSLTGDGYGELSVGKDFHASGLVTLTNIPLTRVGGSLLFEGVNAGAAVATFAMVTTSGIATPPDGSLATVYRGGSLLVDGDMRGFSSISSTPRNDATFSGQAGSITIRGSVDGKSQTVTITAKGLDTTGSGIAAGAGGAVSIGGTCRNLVTIDTFGGSSSGAGTATSGGAGGAITVGGDIYAITALNLRSYGGSANSSSATNANGGVGAPIVIYGNLQALANATFDTRGGSCSGGGTSAAGNGGALNIYGSVFCGGTGQIQTGGGTSTGGASTGLVGNGGAVSVTGDLVGFATLNTTGGSAFGSAATGGGAGGAIFIGANATFNGDMSIDSRGNPTAVGPAGAGGNVTILGNWISNGNTGSITSNGGGGSTGAGGNAGNILIGGDCLGRGGLSATGGTSGSSGLTAGNGGSITIRGDCLSPGGSIVTSGGTNNHPTASTGATGGAVTIFGYVEATVINTSGGSLGSATGPATASAAGNGGAVDLRGGGILTSNMTTTGGVNSNTNTTGNKTGGNAGNVTLVGHWTVTGSLTAGGGQSNGGTTSIGGNGGVISLNGSGVISNNVNSGGGASNAATAAGDPSNMTIQGNWLIGQILLNRGGTGTASANVRRVQLNGNITVRTINADATNLILPVAATSLVNLRVSTFSARNVLTEDTGTTSTAAITTPDQKLFMYAPVSGTTSKWYQLTGTLI